MAFIIATVDRESTDQPSPGADGYRCTASHTKLCGHGPPAGEQCRSQHQGADQHVQVPVAGVADDLTPQHLKYRRLDQTQSDLHLIGVIGKQAVQQISLTPEQLGRCGTAGKHVEPTIHQHCYRRTCHDPQHPLLAARRQALLNLVLADLGSSVPTNGYWRGRASR